MIYLDFSGHLFSDSSLEELYDFAVLKLKMNPRWNHYSRFFPHFDLTTKGKKQLALKMGATYLSDYKSWAPVIAATKQTFQLDLPKYQCKGLLGQDIFRVDFEQYFSLK